MRSVSHKIAIAISLLLTIISFPFAADNVYDYCGYERFCADNIVLLILISTVITVTFSGGIGYLLFIFLNNKSGGDISE